MSDTKPNPKDSMKSTWRTKDRRQWNLAHWFYEITDVHPTNLHDDIPVHQKSEKVPHLSDWLMHRWVIFHAALPLVLHHLYVQYTGVNLTALQAFLFYSVAFKLIAIREIHMLRAMGHQYGFLDGDAHERDGVPDVGVWKVMRSLVSTSTFRPIFTVFLAYRASEAPADMSWWWMPLEAGLYGIILDFWFYWYHRLMHERGSLWQFHRTHHLTKHPNPLLTLYADTEQEIFDIAGIPLLTYFSMKLMGMPMGFYEWWICHQYVVFAELAGHSGLRLHATPPNVLTVFLRMFDAELIIEDHDLHHRKGWKSSGNYGKQTRLWDRVFGTCKDRIECGSSNVDYENQASMPLFF
ncbi:fatty acid hydroxylase superfamily protein [Metarhizium guizhouense ARSEF 977]|uniref:Fatty acid hydroxylase superfamily protein n=1 Tax=Metarhizium guizhouense (strain ARSEF 977) TaxID=1276136 RepID=A0A0B4I1F2_METGA|nr:fatty acid hydroxylase superfamily protein [Metarhizium guizhouense ARSEF 977]